MKKCSVKNVLYFVFAMYLIFSVCVVYIVFFGWDGSSADEAGNNDETVTSLTKHKWRENQDKRYFNRTVHIWGKAAIAEYLWIHIFEGKMSKIQGYLLYQDTITIQNRRFSYITGPYLVPSTADRAVQDLILIVNGREESKVMKSEEWLDSLVDTEKFPQLQNLAIIVLGNERCDNTWLWKYMDAFPLLVKFILIVYDISSSDRPVYQWPLGVATYRDFPFITKSEVDFSTKRKYKCNFLGTVYPNSTREILMLQLQRSKFKCFVKGREKWLNQETEETRSSYHFALKNSDLTLCPVGINSESYRIYEAMSYGSVPILEDIMTPGKCEQRHPSPFSLLKKYKAPVLYVKSWHELPRLFLKEELLSLKEVIDRRKRILEWYEMFRYTMRESLLSLTGSKFT